MYPDLTSITRVCTIGAGPIGGGWAAHFLARGYDVTAYIHDPSEHAALMSVVETGWVSLTALGLADGASLDRLTVTSDLAEAVNGAGFIQESAPENLALKQKILAEIDRHAPATALICSSTSGLRPTELQAGLSHPERFMVGHPFNPVYLLPLVEICGGEQTSTKYKAQAAEIYPKRRSRWP